MREAAAVNSLGWWRVRVAATEGLMLLILYIILAAAANDYWVAYVSRAAKFEFRYCLGCRALFIS